MLKETSIFVRLFFFQKINLKNFYLGKFCFLATVKLELFVYSLYLSGSQGRQTNNHLLKQRNSLCALNANKQKISNLEGQIDY